MAKKRRKRIHINALADRVMSPAPRLPELKTERAIKAAATRARKRLERAAWLREESRYWKK
jgi:hypothetical protein